jgi:hypothetical protein
MAMSESAMQMQLAKDQSFLQRLQYVMVQQARVVREEPQTTPYHPQRSGYAGQVLANPSMSSAAAASTIVGGPNLVGTVDITDAGIVTTVTDAALLSQVATFWNVLAGVDLGAAAPPPL